MIFMSHKKIISMTTAFLFLVSVLSLGNVYAQTPPPLEPQPEPEKQNTSAAAAVVNNDSTNSGEEQGLLIGGKVTIPITSNSQIIIDLPIKENSKIEIVPIK